MGWGDRLRREVEGKNTLQQYRNKVIIGDEEIYCNRLGAVILFQCRTNTLRVHWRQGFVGGAIDCQMCLAVDETVAHFVTECVVLEGVRDRSRVNPRESDGGNIAVQKKDRREGREEHRVVGGDVEEEKKIN